MAEQTTKPTSVTSTKGINQKPTSPKNHVTGVKATAETKNADGCNRRFFFAETHSQRFYAFSAVAFGVYDAFGDFSACVGEESHGCKQDHV